MTHCPFGDRGQPANTIEGGVSNPTAAYSNSTTATTRNMNGSQVSAFIVPSNAERNPAPQAARMRKAPECLLNAPRFEGQQRLMEGNSD